MKLDNQRALSCCSPKLKNCDRKPCLMLCDSKIGSILSDLLVIFLTINERGLFKIFCIEIYQSELR